MQDGSTIRNCVARYKNGDAIINGVGGAVCVWPKESMLGRIGPINTRVVAVASFVMNGGIIEDCHAPNSGGGIYVKQGELDMEHGTIRACSAVNGGGLFVAANASASILGGVVPATMLLSSAAASQSAPIARGCILRAASRCGITR